jgi:Carbon-nitrogen hydrolase
MSRCAARGKVWRVTFCASTPTFTETTSSSPSMERSIANTPTSAWATRSASADKRYKRGFALRAYQPSPRRVYQPAALPWNVTNDAWYGTTSAPYQHLAAAAFRTVENRVPMVRAANTGISAIIDADGRIRWQGPLFETLWHVDDISWPGVRTFYTRYGDVFVWPCTALTVIALLIGIARRRRAA